MKKTIVILLVISLLFSLCSCSRPSSSNENNSGITSDERKYITLAYCINDVLNPYTAVTEFNQNLSNLIYVPLVKTDASFTVKFVLAENINLYDNKCEVTLKTTAFSDGTPLTANDVIYSFNCAKESKKFKALEKAVSSIYKSDDKTVVFTLYKYDPNFCSLLTFPIIKSGTANLKTDNDMNLPPIGCGKYLPDTDNLKLLRNNNYHGDLPYSEYINLYNTPDYEALKYAITTGKVSLWHTNYNGADTIVTNGSTVSSPSNNFIYLGINLENEHLAKPQMRYALSAIISRNEICTNVFEGYAVGTSSIFNPSWSAVKNSIENITDSKNNIFIDNLEEIGYNRLDTSGNRLTDKGKSLSFKLLYCNKTDIKVTLANEIAEQLKKVGINVDLIGLEYDDYVKAINSRNFDLYLAETVISLNMDFSELLCSDGSLNFSKAPMTDQETEDNESTEDSSENNSDDNVYTTLDEIISAYYNGETEIYEFINMFSLELPIIPLCYKNTVLSYQNNLANNWICSPCDPYYSVADCYYK